MTTTTDVRNRETTMELIHEFVNHANTVLLPEEAASRGYSQFVQNLEIEGGRKYIKISISDKDGANCRVHCFIGCADGIWGDVYKPATWSKPALNGARYNLFDPESRDLMYNRFGFSGRHLYMS